MTFTITCVPDEKVLSINLFEVVFIFWLSSLYGLFKFDPIWLREVFKSGILANLPNVLSLSVKVAFVANSKLYFSSSAKLIFKILIWWLSVF